MIKLTTGPTMTCKLNRKAFALIITLGAILSSPAEAGVFGCARGFLEYIGLWKAQEVEYSYVKTPIRKLDFPLEHYLEVAEQPLEQMVTTIRMQGIEVVFADGGLCRDSELNHEYDSETKAQLENYLTHVAEKESNDETTTMGYQVDGFRRYSRSDGKPSQPFAVTGKSLIVINVEPSDPYARGTLMHEYGHHLLLAHNLETRTVTRKGIYTMTASGARLYDLHELMDTLQQRSRRLDKLFALAERIGEGENVEEIYANEFVEIPTVNDVTEYLRAYYSIKILHLNAVEAIFHEEMEARIYEFHLNELGGYEVTTKDTLSEGLAIYLRRSMDKISEDMGQYEADAQGFLSSMEEISGLLSRLNGVEEADIMERDPGLLRLQTEYKQKMTDLSSSLLGMADAITKEYLDDNDLVHADAAE